MTRLPQIAMLADGRRLHLQDGPIDLVVEAWGSGAGIRAAFDAAARRFAWPALVFNPHAQFERLRRDGQFDRLRDRIRDRDVALQGTINPNLSDFGERSEARQYSGRDTSATAWTCPFHANKR